jgi:AraC-like DNA-binding protein
MKFMFLVILPLVVVLAVSTVMAIRYRRKYMDAVNEIDVLRQQVVAISQNTPPQVSAPQSRKKNKSSNPASMNDEELFQYLREGILREQLFLSPNFGRSDVVNHFHITKNRVSAAFSKGSTHSSISDFIRECRLEHARQLIISEPQMSLIEVATNSGFIHATTFSTDFKARYGLTPTQFREQSLKK